MDLLTVDWETYYDDKYSLSHLTTEAYVRDPRFEPILCGFKENDGRTFWRPAGAIDLYLSTIDWANTAVIMHHAHFDGSILNWHYGYRPAMFIDTLSMARVIDGPKAGNGLGVLAPRHGLGEKGYEVTNAKGKHLSDMTMDERHAYGAYCCNDVELTYKLAQIFLPQLPPDELKLIDLTVRMFTEPTLVGNTAMLQGAVTSEQQRKIDLLRRINLLCTACYGTGKNAQLSITEELEFTACPKCGGLGVNKKPIGSNEQFAALLRAQGVDPQTKTSPTTGEQIYAFAKTDPAMQELLEDEEEPVRFLAEARIGVKSNIIETRAQRFLHCAERGPMPVYLSYGAAHTLRWGGGDSMNWQNLSGHNEKRPEMAAIKGSVMAPPGHKLVRVDSSQGEARITAWCAGQHDLVEAFRGGRDVYSEHAASIFGRPVDRRRVKEDFIPGQIGKVSILGMGYGMGFLKAAGELLKGMLGAPPIQFVMKDMEMLGIDPSSFLNKPKLVEMVNAMPSRLELHDRFIHCIVTKALIDRYRIKYDKIVAYWKLMDQVIGAMIAGTEMVFGAHGIMRTGKDCISMPNGVELNYRGLERSDSGDATYFNGRERTRLHGPLLTENTVQCLHRILVAGQMLEIAEVLKVGLMTHDDIVAVVPEGAAPLALDFMVRAMGHVPGWAAGLPLTGEGKIGMTLLEVK